ncbi:SafA/ExsA family spore coat assembly protein, partial [Bacillus sp. JJ1764]|uniref:SafA/ExsA family spore coat assembly protein n=1 Tax=Bacillus sp. JJ1764 TaxID=3122964 RepID=UPI002FFE5D8F
MKIHIVQKGDTLWKIAKKYGVNFEELKKLNSQLSNPDMIMPGMKIKVPTSGGIVKKEGANPGIKKEVPLTDHPFAKEKPIPIKEMPIKEMPIKEMPIKEQPIVKEAPKAPYTPKMPLQVVPEIDINNYYMMNMQQMKVEQPQLPPKPANILPEVKEVPKKEIPIPMKENPIPMKENPIFAPPPKMEAPVEMPMQMPQPQQDYCVPVTPIMPGPGFCPPFGGFPVQPLPFPATPAMPMAPGMVGGAAVPMGGAPVGSVAPMGGTSFMPHHFDESSSFMPQMPAMSPAVNPGAAMGMPGYQQPMQMDP